MSPPESEGSAAPTNLIVLYRGYLFSFDLAPNEQILTAPEIQHQLAFIENWCQQQSSEGPAVGALTATDRTKWALNRQYLLDLSEENKKIIDTIENSLFVVTFDDNQPITQEEVSNVDMD